MRDKGRRADWAAIVLGFAVGLSWIWHGMYGFSGGMFFLLGLGTIFAAVLSVLFVLPWLLGFTHILAAAITAWVGGGLLIALGVFGVVMAAKTHKRHPELAWNNHHDAGVTTRTP
ncbi:hypothetical protein [Nocardiopsis alba]|uniref:Putative membrane protein n=1 Tax=Nocardiopsis alba (strain ATCC BAA-2165 / BE74) TaxID=1205910 RepID=J7LJL2_NOCAA|nr:hypothetical protein [Nocardiopsis alba]AFR11164.1 putative membrane protein [Nocardiopsis alba ATCC BAA-2165]